jgi:succinate dehydrogenase / fumarate reductase cytochrome b subunit
MYQSPDIRPKNLNLFAFKFPLNAIFSILHRITGVALVLALTGYFFLANLIWLHSEIHLADIHDHWIILCLHSTFWLTAIFHWLTGVRHLLAETLFQTAWYEKLAGKWSSYLILILWLAASLYSLSLIWK